LNSFEHAMAFYLFGALQQFFFGGNRRTSRFMMNGALMSKGIDAVSIPAARAQPSSLEEVRRKAREDCLRTYHGKAPTETEPVRGRGLVDKERDPLKSQPRAPASGVEPLQGGRAHERSRPSQDFRR
jgi:hypothetical protein